MPRRTRTIIERPAVTSSTRSAGIHIGPREMFLMMQGLTLLKVQRRSEGDHAEANEAEDLWLELEEHWDRLPAKDRRAGATGER